MYTPPMLYRFTASGPTPEAALALHAAREADQPEDLFVRRADLTTVRNVTVVPDRAPLRAVTAGYFNDTYARFAGRDAEPLGEDDADWLADRLIEDDDPRLRTSAAGALLLNTPGAEPSWLFFGWSVPRN